MESVVVASNEADAAAVERLGSHSAELLATLAARTQAVLAAQELGQPRDELVSWSQTVLLPAFVAKTSDLPRDGQLGLLVEALTTGTRALAATVDALRAGTDATAVIGNAHALRVLAAVQAEIESEHLIPALASRSDVDLAAIADAAQAAAESGASVSHSHGHGGHECGCGESDGDGWPELDARVVPHAIRHATVFGALDAVAAGRGMVLIAPHDPLPLLAQIEQRHPGAFDVSYLERGPEAWRLQFLRRR